MDNNKEKRMVGDTGYEVMQSFRINGKDVILAEKQDAEDGEFNLVCYYREHGIIGEYTHAITTDDYLEAVQEFTKRINTESKVIQTEIDALGIPKKLFTAKDCQPCRYDESIIREVVAIKSSVFSPEYRRGEHQLVFVHGGNGSKANPRATSVYCYHLNDGKFASFARHSVQGIVLPSAMPDWAKESLAKIKKEIDKPISEKKYAGNYEIVEIVEVGNKIFALGHNANAPAPYGTWQSFNKGSRGFDLGHYFSTLEAAKKDLNSRARHEQQYIDRNKRNQPDR